MFMSQGSLRHIQKWSLAMHLEHLLLVCDSIVGLGLTEPGVFIFFPIEFGKVTSILRELNPRPSLDDGVEVLLLLRLGHRGDVSWEQRVWNISQGNIVADSKGLMDSILLLICKFVKHAAHVWHLIMVRDFGGYRFSILSRATKLVICLEIVLLFLDAVYPWRVSNVVG